MKEYFSAYAIEIHTVCEQKIVKGFLILISFVDSNIQSGRWAHRYTELTNENKADQQKTVRRTPITLVANKLRKKK
jgi:hypothetical protein